MQLENVSGLRINTVILDCEGCWTDFVVTYQEKFQHQIDKIILGKLFILNHCQTLFIAYSENDHPNEGATRAGLQMLEHLGFSVSEQFSTGNIKWLGSMLALTKDK